VRVAVIGGAGGMGSVTVSDLARSREVEEVRIVDADAERARSLAERLGAPVRAATPTEPLAAALDRTDGVVNAASHLLNRQVMEACLEVGAHYTDLGGLFHWALAQYELDEAFAGAGLAAAISMGSAPGLTNMLAAACCERLDRIEEIEIADAIIPGRPPDPREAYVPPYAASTLIEEFTADAAVFADGEIRMVPADSGARVYSFPEGDVECVYTIHSEPATLPRSYASRGIRRVEWRLGLPPLDVERLRAFVAAGLVSTAPVRIGGVEVSPRDVLVAVLARQAREVAAPHDPGLVEWFRVRVTGERGGAPAELVAELRVGERPDWPAGGGATATGTPPAVAIGLLCRGDRLRDGVGGPEAMLPVAPFFAELARRGLEGTIRDGDAVEPLAPAA
jgi:saccharopine dehydrogenase-like NADP-dependent oxidoreductase